MAAPSDAHNRQAVLVSVGGLPATGKSTIARKLAVELRAAFVRIDTIETAIGRAEGGFERTNDWELPPGYLVGYEIAAERLRNGVDVVAESVNPSRCSRDAWRDTGLTAGARVVEVKVVRSEATERVIERATADAVPPERRERRTSRHRT